MLNPTEFKNRKFTDKKLTMVTCYDYSFAKIINETSLDAILVGDSVAMVVHGYPTTINATMEMMAAHVAAVARGAPKKAIIADLPFMSYRKGLQAAISAAEILVRAGAHAVKLEGIDGHENEVKRIVESGIPVMGHIGLTPQFINQFGGFKVQGRDPKNQDWLLQQAHKLEECGVFSLVIECVPWTLAEKITQSLSIPTIGIGAGAKTDGQILVLQDLLGLTQSPRPRFVKSFANFGEVTTTSLENYVKEVQSGQYPTLQEAYA